MESVDVYIEWLAQTHMFEVCCLVNNLLFVKLLKVQQVVRSYILIHIDIAHIKSSHILEEMRSLAGFDAEGWQTALHYHFCLTDVSPHNRNAKGVNGRAPSTEADKQEIATL